MNDPIEKAKEIIEEFKHYGPGPHKGSGTPQSVHAGFKKMGGAGVLQAVSGMERTQAREYVARLRAANPKTEQTPQRQSKTVSPELSELGVVMTQDGKIAFNNIAQVRAKLQYYYGDKKALSDQGANAAVTALIAPGTKLAFAGSNIGTSGADYYARGLPNNKQALALLGGISRGSREMASKYPGIDFITGRRFDAGEQIYYSGSSGRAVTLSTVSQLSKIFER